MVVANDCRTHSAHSGDRRHVLLRADNRRGVGTIVDTDAIRYRVYWRDGIGTLCWHARCELTVPRLDYGRQWP